MNSDGDHTNKIEGHWRQANSFSSYLAEFLCRYEHKDEDLFEVFLEDCKKIYVTF